MALVPTLKRMFIPLFFDSHRHPQFAIRFCVFRLFLIAFQRIVFCVESQRARERIRITIWSMSVLKHSKRWLLTCYACWIVTTFTRVHNTHTHTVSRVQLFSHLVSHRFFSSSSPLFGGATFRRCHQIPNFLDFLWFFFLLSLHPTKMIVNKMMNTEQTTTISSISISSRSSK